MVKCKDCVNGIVELFTSKQICDKCGGTGQVSTDGSPSLSSFEKLSTGINDLDQLIQGGLPRGEITTITGHNTAIKNSIAAKVIRTCLQTNTVAATKISHNPVPAQQSNNFRGLLASNGIAAKRFVLEAMDSNIDLIIIERLSQLGNIAFHNQLLDEIQSKYKAGSNSAILAFDTDLLFSSGNFSAQSSSSPNWQSRPSLRLRIMRDSLPLHMKVTKSTYFQPGEEIYIKQL